MIKFIHFLLHSQQRQLCIGENATGVTAQLVIVDTYFLSNKTLPELHASLAHCEAHWHLCYGNGWTSGAA